MATWDDVVAIGKRFPGVEAGTWFGTPALKVAGKGGFCRLRSDPDALVMRVPDEEDKEALLQGDPDVFFTTPHYDGYPFVLVRLEKVDGEQLAELVEDGWRCRATKKLIAEHDGSG
ncbi:MmcQ/YjbR family DNA-binding protein [soil metagenome]